MKRILVIGSGGAGKSTVATRLAQLLDLEVNHLDKFYWRPGWVETPPEEWTQTAREVTPEQWEDLKRRLHESHDRVMATINSFANWDGPFDIGGAMSIVAHTAYHLGGIRQALGVIRSMGSGEPSSQTSATAR